jgi:hypothetical protein
MNFYHRRSFFVVFAIFFVITTPLIIIYSLGFDINYKETQIQNSTSIKIKTNVSDSTIVINQKKVGDKNYEGAISAGGNTDIKIQSPNFYDEDFILSTDKESNSIVDISNLTLLPKSGNFIQKNSNLIQIISPTLSIINQDSKFFVQQYAVDGYVATPKIISSVAFLSGKLQQYKEPEQSTLEVIKDNKTSWKKLSSKVYYKNNHILTQNQDYWLISKLNTFDSSIKNIASIDDQNLLILDDKGSIWSYNFVKSTSSFLDSGYTNFFERENSNQIWLWKNDVIYKTDISEITSQRNSLDRFQQFKNPRLLQETNSNFQIMSVYQGYILRAGSLMMYIPDSKPNSWQLISTESKIITTSSSHVFWIENDNKVISYDFATNTKKYLTTAPSSIGYIEYSKDTNRIFMYDNENIFSYWENKDIDNKPLQERKPQTWITNQKCLTSIIEKSIYCEQAGNLVVYSFNSQI